MRQPEMADRVDAPLDRMQQSACHAVLNRTSTEPELRQLRARDDPMLGPSELRDRHIESRVRFDIYFMANRTLDGHDRIVTTAVLPI
jgi:hypothetical protein